MQRFKAPFNLPYKRATHIEKAATYQSQLINKQQINQKSRLQKQYLISPFFALKKNGEKLL
jgi:hypothetical protein